MEIQRYREARRDRGLAVLEGFQPLKHAARFGADILDVVTADAQRFNALVRALAPDLASMLPQPPRLVDATTFSKLAPAPPRTGVIAIARRPENRLDAALAADAPIVFLEMPARLENIGTAVRVAAAAGTAALLTTGTHDPWHPSALRTGVGLHYAMQVARVDGLPDGERPVIAFDPDGEPLAPGVSLPSRPILAFGSERAGLGEAVLERAALVLRIPMRAGVSSLNLATAVAIALFALSWTRA